ncbi:homeobox domain protein, partial [Ancylostoma ceylanicum]
FSAYIYALYHSGNFDRLFEVIGRSRFDERYYKELQEIWYKARYKEVGFAPHSVNESKRGKELGAVEKYRLRRKYPPPRSIWDGQETIYSFKENSRKYTIFQYLKQFYKQNQYPTLDQKKEISRATDLEIVQISNWFKNRRQRDKTRLECAQYGRPQMMQLQTLAYSNLPLNMNISMPYSCKTE